MNEIYAYDWRDRIEHGSKVGAPDDCDWKSLGKLSLQCGEEQAYDDRAQPHAIDSSGTAVLPVASYTYAYDYAYDDDRKIKPTRAAFRSSIASTAPTVRSAALVLETVTAIGEQPATAISTMRFSTCRHAGTIRGRDGS